MSLKNKTIIIVSDAGLLGVNVVNASQRLGANSIILPGVTIVENSVVASGSVVTKNILLNTIYAGNPAQFF